MELKYCAVCGCISAFYKPRPDAVCPNDSRTRLIPGRRPDGEYDPYGHARV